MITANTNNLAFDSRALDALRSQAKADPNSALRAAAKQLESVFLGMMLKSMREASLDDPYFGSNENKMYTEMFDKQLTQSMADGKGFGLADSIYKQLSASMGASSAQSGQVDGSAGLSRALSPGNIKPVLQPAFHLPGSMPGIQPPPVSKLNSQPLPGAIQPIQPEQKRVSESQEVESQFLDGSPEQFISRLWSYAEKAAKDLGVPAHFLLGHAALESGWGRREIPLADGSSSYNIFGIKAGESWSGARTSVMTTEYVNGTPRQRLETFRAYGSYEEAFRDYGELLLRRYPKALAAGQSPESFARGLARGGYASDPLYADKLQRVINGGAMRNALQATSPDGQV